MTSHLEEGILHELLDGEIPSSELPPIEGHLASCAECRARLEDARGFQAASDRLIEELDQPDAPAPSRQRPGVSAGRSDWKRNLAWAATVVIAVGAGYYGRGSTVPASIQEAEAVQPAVEKPATVPLGSPVAPTPAVAAARQPARANQPATGAAPGAGGAVLPEKQSGRNELKSADQLAVRADAEETRPKTALPVPGVANAAAGAAAATPPAEPSAPAQRSVAPRENQARFRESIGTTGLVSGAALAAKAAAAPDTISFPEALRRLNGTLRLIEGMVPDRIEALGQETRVVYPLSSGELYLTQQLINGRIEYRLTAPAGFPADSLQRLRLRIRD